jgi:hypothetical protein
VAYQLTLIRGRIEHQPIQARKSIRVVRLRPKVRQTAALLVPLYRERRATGLGKP